MATKTKLSQAKCEQALQIIADWMGPKYGLGKRDAEAGKYIPGSTPTGEAAAFRASGPQLLMEWDWPSGGPTPTILLEGIGGEWAYMLDAKCRAELDKLGIYAEPFAGYAFCLYPAG